MRAFMSVYHAKKIDIENADITQYESPNEIITRANYFTVEKASASGVLAYLQFGSQITSYWTAIANSLYFADTFHIGDYFWLEGEKPIVSAEEEYGIGCTATAVVTNIANQGRTIILTLSTNKEKINV